ncbi:hypothetical protein DPMN_107293 [Dreissena polymorpha]|uniref:Uncharacterized protein n=1 Tax=Dreissena polymorpha TaxID=45954 RepID=A0A9D4K6F9_DREPO|nr:hypothetical protein DPMN_107293 [Dreissena polymorpha]
MWLLERLTTPNQVNGDGAVVAGRGRNKALDRARSQKFPMKAGKPPIWLWYQLISISTWWEHGTACTCRLPVELQYNWVEVVLEISPPHTTDTTPADSEAPADFPTTLLCIKPSPVTRILSSDKPKAANCEARLIRKLWDIMPTQPGRTREMRLAKTAEIGIS